jgi:Cd2+/Zn2+-exporting ATPase
MMARKMKSSQAVSPSVQFRIGGMDCAEEVAVLKRELGPLVGGEQYLAFDILNGKMSIDRAPKEVSPEAIIAAITRTGMRAQIWRDSPPESREAGFWRQGGRTALTAASGVFALAGFLVHSAWAGCIGASLGS